METGMMATNYVHSKMLFYNTLNKNKKKTNNIYLHYKYMYNIFIYSLQAPSG